VTASRYVSLAELGPSYFSSVAAGRTTSANRSAVSDSQGLIATTNLSRAYASFSTSVSG